jgi:O-methyltransferase
VTASVSLIYQKIAIRARDIKRERTYRTLYDKFSPYTMMASGTFVKNMLLVDRFRAIPGLVVECGTWKGGCIAGIASVLGPSRKYILFDSYEGLPPARDIDGPSALAWQRNTKGPSYFENCSASEQDAAEAMKLCGASHYDICKGWFSESLPAFVERHSEPIAILRLDGDWYESTMDCLKWLFPLVASDGLVILDDYRSWDGCARAVHDYLSESQTTARLLQYLDEVSYIVKQNH